MRKKIYKWHRTLSLIIAGPVILWAASGFMHPIMTNIRPAVATQFYTAPAIDTSQVNTSLQDCLYPYKIDSFSNVRIVQMGGQQFYQVLIDNQHTDIRYFSTKTGRLLTNGDELYARFLATKFLEGSGDSTGQPSAEPMAMSDHDCCIMATMNIMNSKGAKITGVDRITRFSGEYKYINRLLPVYKVSFDRKDGIRLYVETAFSRFGFAVDNKRAAFDRFFGWFHTWEWMNALGNTKYFIMIAITLLGFLTTLMGLYIFFITKTKKSSNPLIKSRRNHRYISLTASLFTLLFTFSGGFHALDKVLPKEPLPAYQPLLFASPSISLDIKRLDSASGYTDIQNISLARIGDKTYWQVFPKKRKPAPDSNVDLMKNRPAQQATVLYIEAEEYTTLPDGDRQNAEYLAGLYSHDPAGAIKSAIPVMQFDGEYGFINKRLPVWKISYSINDNERYYIETTTGTLSTRVQDKDLVEGYSFSFLHKHHFMDWAGKSVRDISTMFWAAMQIVMVVFGLILYTRWRKNRLVKKSS